MFNLTAAANRQIVPIQTQMTPDGLATISPRTDGRPHQADYKTTPMIQQYKRTLRSTPMNQLIHLHHAGSRVDGMNRSAVEVAAGELICEKLEKQPLSRNQQEWLVSECDSIGLRSLITDNPRMVSIRQQLKTDMNRQCLRLIKNDALKPSVLLSIKARASHTAKLTSVDQALARHCDKLETRELIKLSKSSHQNSAQHRPEPSSLLQERACDELINRLQKRKCPIDNTTLADLIRHPRSDIQSLALDRLEKRVSKHHHKIADSALQKLARASGTDSNQVANQRLERLASTAVEILTSRMQQYSSQDLYHMSSNFPVDSIKEAATNCLMQRVNSNSIERDYLWREMVQQHPNTELKQAAMEKLESIFTAEHEAIAHRSPRNHRNIKLPISPGIIAQIIQSTPNEQLRTEGRQLLNAYHQHRT